MNLTKAIRWGLLLLIVVTIVAYPYFEISIDVSEYWLLPVVLFLFWFALLFHPGYRITALSLLLGILELLPLLALYFFVLLFGPGFEGLICHSIANITSDNGL